MKNFSLQSILNTIINFLNSICDSFSASTKRLLKNLLSFLRYGFFRRTLIMGSSNLIDIRVICIGTHVKIAGHGNSITIHEGAKIEGLKVFIIGNNSSLSIGKARVPAVGVNPWGPQPRRSRG